MRSRDGVPVTPGVTQVTIPVSPALSLSAGQLRLDASYMSKLRQSRVDAHMRPELQACDFAPNRPFESVLELLRDACFDGQLEPAVSLFCTAWRPVWRQLAFRVIRRRHLDWELWADVATDVVEQVAAEQVRSLASATFRVQDLPAFLARPVEQRFADATHAMVPRSPRA